MHDLVRYGESGDHVEGGCSPFANLGNGHRVSDSAGWIERSPGVLARIRPLGG
jgi:hypothetical protein